jgi:hypothetical protein
MLSSECAVCGHRRNFKNLCYDNQLNAYCGNPKACGKHHPNSLFNCQKRGTFLELMDYDEARQYNLERHGATYRAIAATSGNPPARVSMARLSTGSVSFRIKNERQSDYIAYIIAKSGARDISSAILHILDDAMERDAQFLAHFSGKKMAEAHIPTPVTQYKEVKELPTELQPPTVPLREVDADEGEFIL